MLDAEYYRLNSKGKRVYNGYKTWQHLHRRQPPAARRPLEALPGQAGALRGVLRATDTANNVSKPVKKRFEIVG